MRIIVSLDIPSLVVIDLAVLIMFQIISRTWANRHTDKEIAITPPPPPNALPH